MAKEKKEKVVVRKCHYCKKPLDEGKDFCLHCGHTYTEEDPFAEAKKAKKKKFWIKTAIKGAIVLGVLLIIAVAVLFIVKEITKSDYLRIVEFIKEEGEFVEGEPLDGGEESEESSSEEASAESSEAGEENSEQEPESERRMTMPEAYDRYVYEMEQDFYLVALEDASTSFYIIYETEADGLYNKIIVEISDEDNTEYLWESFITYTGDNVVDSRYDFDYSYHGSFDPSDFVTKTEDGELPWKVEIVTQIKEETEDETTDEENPDGENPDGDESSSEEESEESSSEDESSSGEGEEDEEPQLTPEQARENAMVESVTETVRFMIHYLAKCIEEYGIGASFDELGFTKYFNYLESLDPLNDPFANLNI